MKLHNTLTKNIDTLQPIEENKIRIYSCGPTVYDHAHIGNMSAYIFADMLRRIVKLSGYDVLHAMNYTDVDDKTIRRSHEQYPELDPKEALKKLTDHYIRLFLEDMAKIGNDTSALTFLRATNPKTIQGMKDLITKLYKGGFAYVADDGVYFSIEAYRKSGKTYGQLLELSLENTSEERIQNDEYDKESIHDFALWKKQKDNEPAWEFTLDNHDLTGRPGWHIECSVMSRQALGQPFDIHTGGVDLIFPHHENEIAQSTAGEKNALMASIFAHNEHILVEGKKMAKSANNFYTLKDIIDHGYAPIAFRLLVLQAHYRSQVHFSWENLEAAQNRLKGYQEAAALALQTKDDLPVQDSSIFTKHLAELQSYLEDDLNTSQALASLSGFLDVLKDRSLSTANRDDFRAYLAKLDEMFGLELANQQDISGVQEKLIADRKKARAEKDWAKSDQLRDKLKEQGIGIRDTDTQTVWYRL